MPTNGNYKLLAGYKLNKWIDFILWEKITAIIKFYNIFTTLKMMQKENFWIQEHNLSDYLKNKLVYIQSFSL